MSKDVILWYFVSLFCWHRQTAAMRLVPLTALPWVSAKVNISFTAFSIYWSVAQSTTALLYHFSRIILCWCQVSSRFALRESRRFVRKAHRGTGATRAQNAAPAARIKSGAFVGEKAGPIGVQQRLLRKRYSSLPCLQGITENTKFYLIESDQLGRLLPKKETSRIKKEMLEKQAYSTE